MRRRNLLLAAGAAGLGVLLAGPASAQSAADFPNKPITLIMPWPAGTGIDMWHRAMADAGRQDSRPAGRSSTTAPAPAARWARRRWRPTRSPTATPSRTSRSRSSAFRSCRRRPTTRCRTSPTSSTSRASCSASACVPIRPFKTFNDMIEFARANPGKLTYGTPGAGTSLHIGMEQIALKAGVKWTQVPVQGRARDPRPRCAGGHVMAAAEGRRLVAARRRRQGARARALDRASATRACPTRRR